MSDQQPPASQDTAAVAGPNEAPGTAQEQAEVDWQKRHADLQPEYTRARQQVSELEQRQQWYEIALTSEDPDTQRQALEVLGYELPEPEQGPEEFEPAEYDDPVEAQNERLTRLEQRIEQEQEAMRMAEQGALIRDFVDERMGQFEGLPSKAQEWILAYAVNALPAVHEPGVPVPLPDLAQAHQAWQELQTEAQQSWAKTKKAPRVMPGGVTADQVPDPGTGHESRMNRAMRFIHDNTDQE